MVQTFQVGASSTGPCRCRAVHQRRPAPRGGHVQGSRDVEKLAGKNTCRPKHLDADVRTGTIPWELIEEQRLFGSQRGSL